MSLIDTIKGLLGGNKDAKAVGALSGVIEAVKPLLEGGNLSELVKGALANFGDLGDQFSAITGQLKGAKGQTRSNLTAQKSDILSQIKEKGAALLESLAKEENLPDAVKALVAKAQTLLAKL